MYGAPAIRFFRQEVEALVVKLHGERYLKQHVAKVKLARVNTELTRLESPGIPARERCCGQQLFPHLDGRQLTLGHIGQLSYLGGREMSPSHGRAHLTVVDSPS
jgi:hypothetical protein